MIKTLLGALGALACLSVGSSAWANQATCLDGAEGQPAIEARVAACAEMIARGGDAATLTDAYRSQAIALSDLKRSDEALKSVDRALALSPDNLFALILRSQILADLNRVDEAIEAATMALKAHPDQAFGWYQRAFLWHRYKSEPAKALADYNAAISADPGRAMPYSLRAELADTPQAALLDLNKAVALDPKDVQFRLDRADVLIELSRVSEAMADYNEALRLEPDNVDAVVGRVYAAGRLGDLKGALKLAEAGRSRLPNVPAIQMALGFAHEMNGNLEPAAIAYQAASTPKPAFLALTALTRVQRLQGRYDQALATIAAAEALKPDSPFVPLQRGSIWLDQEQYAKAVAQYDLALGREPTAEAFHNRGLAHSGLQDHKAALADFTKAAELDPDRVDTLVSIGHEQAWLEMPEAALKSYDRALTLDPDSIGALVGRADQLAARGDVAGAALAYERAVSVQPDDPDLWLSLAEIRNGQGDLAQSLKLIDRALKLDPKSQLGLTRRAEVLSDLGRPAEAVKSANTGLALYPEDQDLLYLRSGAYVALEDLPSARKDLDRFLTRDPKALGALNRRGEVHRLEGNYDLARADFDKVIALDPKVFLPVYNRALVAVDEQRYDRAILDFNLALVLSPGDPDALSEKAETYRRMGDLLSATETVEAVIKAHPDMAHAWYVRSLIKTDMGDKAGAASDMAQAKRLDPRVQ